MINVRTDLAIEARDMYTKENKNNFKKISIIYNC